YSLPAPACRPCCRAACQPPPHRIVRQRFVEKNVMEQRFEGTPKASIFVKNRRVYRSEVTNDWGLRLQWEVRRNGLVIATPNARPELSYEHPDPAPGVYEI